MSESSPTKNTQRLLIGYDASLPTTHELLIQNKPEADVMDDPVLSFPAFFFGIFAIGLLRVEGKFTEGRHLIGWCSAVQLYPKTLLISARKHLKSTVGIAFVMWCMWRALFYDTKKYTEWLYMSYKEDLAEYQLKRVNRYIEMLPEFFGDAEKITDALGIIRYAYNGKEFICEPAGILTFKRGRHPDVLICDDILKDPQNPKIPLAILNMIERTFVEEIDAMPKERLHIFGTPQDENDLFSKIEGRTDYWTKRCPAIVNEARGEALWPNEYNIERLLAVRKNIGLKAFNKEYMCRPSRGEDAFFKGATLDVIIKPRLKNYDIHHPPKKLREMTFAGFDIGKKSHPSHFCILAESRRRVKLIDLEGNERVEPRLIQVHSKWMDGWDYKDQIEYITLAVKQFKIARLFFDNTRGEFEGHSERGELCGEMSPFIFSLKSKGEIATKLDEKVTTQTLLLLDDERQRRQLLSVDNDYNAMQSSEGHGDCFWSLALAIHAWVDGKGTLIWNL